MHSRSMTEGVNYRELVIHFCKALAMTEAAYVEAKLDSPLKKSHRIGRPLE